jgi:WD40 repeat protein
MSVTGYFSDLQFLIAAHHVETALTADSLHSLTGAFCTYGTNARRITPQGFVKIVQEVTTQLPDEVLKEHFTEAALRQWFSWLDTDSSGSVEWRDFQSALSIASAMQKYHTVLNGKTGISHCKLTVQMCEKIVYLDCWRRSVICSASKDLKMYSTTGSFLGQLSGHSAAVSGAVFLRPIGQLCTVGCDRQVLLWDHKHSTPVGQFLLDAPALCAVYEPTTRLLWLGGLDGHLVAYDISSGPVKMVRRTAAKHGDWIKDLIQIPELSLLMTASLDGTVKMWSLDGQLLCTKEGHSRCVYFIVYMAHVGLAFSAGQGKEICAWNPFSMDSCPVQLLYGHEHEMVGLVGDPLNKSLVSCDAGGRLIVWDAGRLGVKLQILDLAAVLNGLSTLRSMCQNPVTREVMIITNSSYIRVASPLSAQRPPKLGNKVLQLIAAQEVNLAIVTTAHAIYCYDLIEGHQVAAVEAPFGANIAIRHMSLLNPLHLAAFSDDRRVALMPLREFALEPSTKPHRLQGVVYPTVLPSIPAGAVMAHTRDAANTPCQIVFRSGLCTQYKFAKSHVVQMSRETLLQLSGANVKCAEFAEDLQIAAVLSDSGVVIIWDWKSFTTRQVLPSTHKNAPSSRTLVEPGCEIQQIMFHRSRNALLAMDRHGLVILNIGNFLQLIRVDYDVCVPLGAALVPAGTPTLQTSMRDEGSTKTSDNSASRVMLGSYMVLLDGDTLWATTNLIGHVATIPLLAAFGYFFASQTRSITAESKAATTSSSSGNEPALAIQNNHFSILSLMRQSVAASLYLAVDRRSSEPVVAKVYADFASHAADLSRRTQLGTAFDPCFVTYLCAWDHSTAAATSEPMDGEEPRASTIPKGAWHHCIVMQKGDVTLRQLVLDGSLTQSDKDFACVSVLKCVTSLLEAGFVPTDLRTRNFVRVGDAWKLCTIDTLRTPGESWGRNIFASSCPPELCESSGRIKTCPSIAEARPIVAWMLAIAVFEIQTSTAAFADRNENFLYSTVQMLTLAAVKQRMQQIPPGSAAATILDACFVVDPSERQDAISGQKLLNLLAVRGHKIDYGTLFARANCWRNGSMTQFPSQISDDVAVQVTRKCSDDLVTPLPLANVSQLVACASAPSADVFLCVNSNSVQNGDGAIHIFTKTGDACGFVPAPELGDETLAEWQWPNIDETYARQEALQRNKKSGGEGPGGANASGGDKPLASVSDEVLEQLAPPPGWQTMSASEIAREMLRGADLSLPSSTQECVDRFVRVMLRKSPFFRGGQLEGEPIPLYSAPLVAARHEGRMAGAGEGSFGTEERRRRWKAYWEALRLELGGGAKGAHALPTNFILRLPTLGHESDSVNDDIAKIFGRDDASDLLDSSNPTIDPSVLRSSAFRRVSSPVRRRPARHEKALTQDNYLTCLNRLDRLDAEDFLKERGVEEQLEVELREVGRRAVKRQKEETMAKEKMKR